MRAMIRRFIRDEEAATAVEYALIAGLIAAVLLTVLTDIGEQAELLLQKIATALENAAAGS